MGISFQVPGIWVYETVFREDVGGLIFNGGECCGMKAVLKAGSSDAVVTET